MHGGNNGQGFWYSWENTTFNGQEVSFTLRKNCEVSAAMGTNITTITPSDDQLTSELAVKNVTKIDTTPPKFISAEEERTRWRNMRWNVYIRGRRVRNKCGKIRFHDS